ncbi:hypothetical protein ACFV6F_31680 [Kitasatospora phosalacinea]|uniref:hypothetical protein n=1 Tax=Kitasatospora phosalacinea TaxID=2065 RepID=UPI003654E094
MTAAPAPLARVLTLLDCMAAEPRLGGLLLFDLDPALLPLLGRLLAERLDGAGTGGDGGTGTGGAGTGCAAAAPVVVLGAWTTAENLWLRTAPTAHGFALEPGALVEHDHDRPPPVVLVPDLQHAPLPVVHAALALLDSDAAAQERLGHSFRWEPRARWLAALPRAAAGNLSPHLLDRFPLRADAGGLAEALADLRTAAGPDAAGPPAATGGSMTSDALALLRAALPARTWPGRSVPLSPEAVALVVAQMPGAPGHRRDLALARTARALAAAAGADGVGAEHVHEAARLFGLAQSQAPAPPVATTPAPPPAPRLVDPPEPAAPTTAPAASSAGATVERSAVAAPEPRPLPAEPAPVAAALAASPYPEDDPTALPPFASLRADHRRPGTDRPTGGHRTGVRPARDLHGIALVPTLLEAAKFQAVRAPDGGPGRSAERTRLTVSAADLRQYRHARDSGRTLLLVLDHSCRTGWDPAPALAPHLRWAHRQNAAVTVVEFGHRGAPTESAAERYRAASLLDPRIPASVGRAPGLASPLAHALDLVAQELRRLKRRARGGHQETVLVVVTDGRGNVPLDASLLGRVTARVAREGIIDALTAAAAVRRLAPARTVLLTPETGLYPELTHDLAESLGAELFVQPLEPLEPAEPTALATPVGDGPSVPADPCPGTVPPR